MTPSSTGVRPVAPAGLTDRPATPQVGPPGGGAAWFSPELFIRLIVTVGLVLGYYALRRIIVNWLQWAFESLLGVDVGPSILAVLLVVVLLVGLVFLWRKTLAKDKRFYAPMLITSILLLADSAVAVLETHHSTLLSRLTGGLITAYSPTFAAILAAVLTEMVIGRFYYGKWPNLVSAYISGISAGILIKSPSLWPFVMCAVISITSKYVLRVGDRHLWNPTNLGMTLMLFLAPQYVAMLSVEAGNEWYAIAVIWMLGAFSLYKLGILHIPLAFVLTFVPLAYFRTWVTGQPINWMHLQGLEWLPIPMTPELAPVTSPMFQLFIFFMITDPKTVTRKRWSQVLVAVLVGFAETFLRLVFRDKYSLFHSLFFVGPITNLIEIGWYRLYPPPKKAPATVAPVALAPAR
jgi:hypothetical protein